MKVTDIDIQDLTRDEARGCFRAAVSMTLRHADSDSKEQVNFICRSARAADCPSSLITYDLVTHALEQARAMPGFRRGEEQISVEITAALDRLPLAARA